MDLQTINELELVIKAEFKSRVMELEQQARDAESQDMHSYSRELRHAAREVEVFSYRISTAFTACFIDQLDRMTPSVERSFTIKSPQLPPITPIVQAELVD